MYLDMRPKADEPSLASVADEVEMEEGGDDQQLLKKKVNSMNFDLVTRLAPVTLVVSPRVIRPIAGFYHSSKVIVPGRLLPPRPKALEYLRRLAAGRRACSSQGHVESVCRRRGRKAVDSRLAGITITFQLDEQRCAQGRQDGLTDRGPQGTMGAATHTGGGSPAEPITR
ncbi:unnamed protein product, partial [Discosporangium mesarthrocarpum]